MEVEIGIAYFDHYKIIEGTIPCVCITTLSLYTFMNFWKYAGSTWSVQ